MLPEKVVSGAQTGADRGGLKAAITLGISIGGWCPKNRRAEDGKIPDLYPLQETPSADYPQRTEWNVRDSDATLVFTWGKIGRGSALTASICERQQKPCLMLDLHGFKEEKIAEYISNFLKEHRPRVLNIAGSRESKAPGIEVKVERVMALVLEEARKKEGGSSLH